MNTTAKTRFDTRIPKDQKDLFQHAAELGGFKTLSEFVLYSAKVQAEIIVRKHESVLASERDAKIFFEAVMNPPSANAQLKKAAKEYRQLLSKK